jgi:hypothetical protein
MSKKSNIEIVQECVKGCGLADVPVRVDEKNFYVEGHPAIEIDGWIYISTVEHTIHPRGIKTLPPKQVLAYQIEVASIVHGVRYYPDGSGEPDSVDISDVGEPHLDIYSAVKAAVALYTQNLIEHIAEANGMAEMAEEEEKYWKEMSQL